LQIEEKINEKKSNNNYIRSTYSRSLILISTGNGKKEKFLIFDNIFIKMK